MFIVFVRQPGHVLRQRGSQGQHFSRHRVHQAQRAGVEGRAGDEGSVLRAVEPVSGQRMADGSHVQPQLVGAPGLGHQLYKTQSVPAGEHLVVRYGGGSVRPDHAPDGGVRILADGGVDGALRRVGTADADAPVLPVKSLRMELAAQ